MCESKQMQSKYPALQPIIFSFVSDEKSVQKKARARGSTLICKDSKWYNSNPAIAADTSPIYFSAPVSLGKYPGVIQYKPVT